MPVALKVERGPYAGLRRAEILRRARAMCDALQLREAELSIVLTGDAQIRKLNKDFRDKDRPTDVLAFAMREGEGAALHGQILGDVVVSVETARIQAARAGRDVLGEVTMLLAHGLLHLLGYDHDTRAKDREMRAETDRLCAAAASEPAAARAPRATKSRALRARAPAHNRRQSRA